MRIKFTKWINRDPNKKIEKNNEVLYFSGYLDKLPIIEGLMIGPKWKFTTEVKNYFSISGVNFIGPLIRTSVGKKYNRGLNHDKKYRAIYIGNSSTNKACFFALFVMLITRPQVNQKDVFILQGFHSFPGKIRFALCCCVIKIIKSLKISIDFYTSKNGVEKETVYKLISDSKFGLIPYKKEGFPRVIGEFFYYDVEPLVWNRLKFGGEEIMSTRSIELKSLFQIILILIKNKKNNSCQDPIRKKFIEPHERLSLLLKIYGLEIKPSIDDSELVCFYHAIIKEDYYDLTALSSR